MEKSHTGGHSLLLTKGESHNVGAETRAHVFVIENGSGSLEAASETSSGSKIVDVEKMTIYSEVVLTEPDFDTNVTHRMASPNTEPRSREEAQTDGPEPENRGNVAPKREGKTSGGAEKVIRIRKNLPMETKEPPNDKFAERTALNERESIPATKTMDEILPPGCDSPKSSESDSVKKKTTHMDRKASEPLSAI